MLVVCECLILHMIYNGIVIIFQDDRYFLSGSLDGKLRLWNIPDKKVALWNEVSGATKLITAANFCLNGRFAVVGTYDGRCIFYNTDVSSRPVPTEKFIASVLADYKHLLGGVAIELVSSIHYIVSQKNREPYD